MSDETYVPPYSNEWIYATFRLQLILGSPLVKLTSLRKHTSSFPQQYQGFLKVETAVDLTHMDQPSIESIKQSLRKDLLLKAGRIHLNLKDAHEKKYRVLLLKTAFSQALPSLRDTGLSVHDFLAREPNFDAVYMSPRQQQLSVFSHEYLVKDSKQYQWEYDAQFIFAQSCQWKAEKIYCANCKLTTAKWFCIQDEEAYCEGCFGDLHRTHKKSKHTRQPISPYNCPRGCSKALHHNEPLTHYCFNCKQLKCVHCLADSQHEVRSEGAHQTMLSRQFASLFNDTLKQKISEAKNKIVNMIKQIEAKIQLIAGHYELRVKQFAKAFEERVASVRQWVSDQLNVAAGFHSELKRKYDETIWLQALSVEIEQKCEAQMTMQVKEGINIYLRECFSSSYFSKLQRKVQDLKLFS